MKKFLLSLVLCGVAFGAWADTFNCKLHELGAFNIKSSNEYLYPTQDHYVGDGEALVCGHPDSTDGCAGGTLVLLSGSHVFKGNVKTGTEMYKCNYTSGWGDEWEVASVTSLTECDDVTGMEEFTFFTGNNPYKDYVFYASIKSRREFAGGVYYICSGGACCYLPKSQSPSDGGSDDNSDAQICNSSYCAKKYGMGTDKYNKCMKCCKAADGGQPANWIGNNCYCSNGYDWIESEGKCEKTGGGNDGGESSLKNCLKERADATYSDEARACCYLSKSVAKMSSDKQRCECADSAKEFKMNSDAKGGRCVAKSGGDDDKVDVTGYDCSDFMEGLLELQKRCAEVPTASQVLVQIKKLITDCKAKKYSYDVAWDMYLKLTEGVDTYCTVKNESAVYEGRRQNMAAEAIARINSLHTSLEGVRSGFKVSVWKDEEGKFNTARLASDSIAGVVLGTAGGLITSSVVKKNQEKKGFEDLQCTIGGQRVADWGDQFTAGWAR